MEGVPILLNRKSFTPFYFYTDFLTSVAGFYQAYPNKKITFFLIGEPENESFFSSYYFDPISIPLFLSLVDQLSKHHKEPLDLELFNTNSTINVLAFLERADFFKLAGNSYNFSKNILNFNSNYLGFYETKKQRPEHRVRYYSINDGILKNIINNFPPEQQRDYLIEFYTYKIRDHFEEILKECNQNDEVTFEYVQILSELITNGVLHSLSDVYALMFTDREKTSFSISDNGIGLYESLLSKENRKVNDSYQIFDLFRELMNNISLNVDEKIKESFFSIFEALFFSILKDRKGLFDLMTTVVLNSNGYFRLHNNNAQIIISLRMFNELKVLSELRKNIFDNHMKYLSGNIKYDEFNSVFLELTNNTKIEFKKLVTSIISNYNIDVKYSSIRLYEVRFRGVHIEVEIPKKY
jgi:anti-sigma regulatory factor (Ser/Thr protein kinase)